MPVFNSKQLLADLEADVQTCIAATAHWQQPPTGSNCQLKPCASHQPTAVGAW
jgi:hypothetical protein